MDAALTNLVSLPALLIACLLFALASAGDAAGPPPALPEGDTGIDARYPGDVGIGKDPAVIFHEDFEDCRTTADLSTKWDAMWGQAHISIADELRAGRPGVAHIQQCFDSAAVRRRDQGRANVEREVRGVGLHAAIILRRHVRMDHVSERREVDLRGRHRSGIRLPVVAGTPAAMGAGREGKTDEEQRHGCPAGVHRCWRKGDDAHVDRPDGTGSGRSIVIDHVARAPANLPPRRPHSPSPSCQGSRLLRSAR